MKNSKRKEIEKLEKLQTFMVNIKLLKKGQKIVDYQIGCDIETGNKCMFLDVE